MTMFQTYAWNSVALRVFKSREAARVVLVENDSGAALLPCVAGKCGKTHFAGEALFDYRTPLMRGDERVLGSALEIVASWGNNFEVTAVRGEPTCELLRSLEPSFFANAPTISRADISDVGFLAMHRRLGRHSRRIKKQGVEFHRHPGTNRALLSLIYECKGNQEVGSNLFRDRLRQEFMVEIASHRDVNCEVFTYETAGHLVAALVTFRDRSIRRFYTTYFDERWAPYSPGQVLLFESCAESLREGLDCDLMTGEYPYKNRIATGMVPLYRIAASPDELREVAQAELSASKPLAA